MQYKRKKDKGNTSGEKKNAAKENEKGWEKSVPLARFPPFIFHPNRPFQCIHILHFKFLPNANPFSTTLLSQ